jgi:hypothetical protein
LAFVLICGSNAPGEWSGDGELLRGMATEHRDNKERILTWTGSATVDLSDMEDTGTNGVHNLAHVDFAYDQRNSRMRWAWTYDECVQIKDGQERHVVVGSKVGMVKDGAYYVADPASRQVDGAQQFIIHGLDELRRGHMSDDFDPFIYFAPHDVSLDQRFEGLYELWKKAQEQGGSHTGWTIAQDGDLVTVETRREVPDYGSITNRYVVDRSRGSTVRSYESSDPEVQQTFRFDFENVGGAWLPKTFALSLVNLKRKKTASAEVRWTENRINEPLPEDEFSLDALGARSGDRVDDIRAGVQFTFRPETGPGTDRRSHSFWGPVGLALAAPAILLAAFLIHRLLAPGGGA